MRRAPQPQRQRGSAADSGQRRTLTPHSIFGSSGAGTSAAAMAALTVGAADAMAPEGRAAAKIRIAKRHLNTYNARGEERDKKWMRYIS